MAIVTGGAGGVGRALVRTLPQEGAAAMVADLASEGCRALADEVEAAGGTVAYVVGDLRDKAYCERVVAETRERFGGVDLTAMFYLCRAATPAIEERGGGAIVNTSSVWGVYPALVTGGGRGIGRGIVDRVLEEGAQVAVVQRQPLDDALARRPQVIHVAADLSVPSSIATAVERAVDRFGVVDILGNNAGIMFERTVSEISLDEWDLMMAVNLRAPLFLARAVLPHMRARGGGSIINIGSIEGIGANPGHAAYCASKAGVHGLTRAMAVDLGGDGIRCNAIAPGWITSDLSEAYLESHPDPAAARAALNSLHPVGRLGRPTDVGDLAVYLASDRSSFLTGETVVLDCGRTAKLPLPS